MLYPRKMFLAAGLSVVMAGSIAGCFVFDDDDDPCPLYDSAAPGLQAVELLRDPATGQCEEFFQGGGGGGGGICGPTADPVPPPVRPDHATCYAFCEGLDEATCRDTPACRAAYANIPCPDGNCEPTYFECWGTAPSGPVQGGDCTVLGAEECSRHDDCIAIHGEQCSDPTFCGVNIGEFEACANEVLDPGAGNCYGQPACDDLAPDCPTGTFAGHDGNCWTGFCIPLDQCEPAPACGANDEATCISEPGCEPTYRGVDCSCDEINGCSCLSWDFHRCDDSVVAP